VSSNRIRFVAARFLLRVALRDRFGVIDAKLISPDGTKPSAAGTGLPAYLDVNLSHAGERLPARWASAFPSASTGSRSTAR
jgi:hypothetical protein